MNSWECGYFLAFLPAKYCKKTTLRSRKNNNVSRAEFGSLSRISEHMFGIHAIMLQDVAFLIYPVGCYSGIEGTFNIFISLLEIYPEGNAKGNWIWGVNYLLIEAILRILGLWD